MYSEHGKHAQSGYVTASNKLVRLGDVKPADTPRILSGTPELDRVLGGGFVPGGIIFLAGDSGIGKSTLSLQIAGAFSMLGKSTMYISGEENSTQIYDRSQRLGIDASNVLLACTGNLEVMIKYIREHTPKLVVIDSLQTTTSKTSKTSGGSPTQLKKCCRELTKVGKELNIPIIMIGHITKAGEPAGPKELQHVVDVVLAFEGSDGLPTRTLRATKNRFGSTDELGLFEMKGDGLHVVLDPSAFFLQGRNVEQAGSVVVPITEGNKVIMAEIQTTLAESAGKTAKRHITGLDSKRVAHILNTCTNMLGFGLDGMDVSINVSGHYEIKDPAADLAILLSVASAFFGQAIPEVAAAGELGIHGDIRVVPKCSQRAAEAGRLGLSKIVLAKHAQVSHSAVVGCGSIVDAIENVFFSA